MDFIKDTVPGAPGFRGKFDENSGCGGQGFVHHEKRTLEENCKESRRSGDGMGPAGSGREHAHGPEINPLVKVFERQMNANLSTGSGAFAKIVSIVMGTGTNACASLHHRLPHDHAVCYGLRPDRGAVIRKSGRMAWQRADLLHRPCERLPDSGQQTGLAVKPGPESAGASRKHPAPCL